MNSKQLDALGPLAREIVEHDRATALLCASQILDLGLAAILRARRSDRLRLSEAAARLCSRVAPIGGGRPTAVSVTR